MRSSEKIIKSTTIPRIDTNNLSFCGQYSCLLQKRSTSIKSIYMCMKEALKHHLC